MSAPRLMRRPLATFATATVFAIVALGGTPPAVAQTPEDVLSHFLCYRGSFAPFEPEARLFEDQFDF